MKIGNLIVGVHNTSEISGTNWQNKTRVTKEIGKIKEELQKQSREYWNLKLEDNTGILKAGLLE